MRSAFWSFVEACDETRSVDAVRDLLQDAAIRFGFKSYALTTHAPHRDLQSLHVLVHTWKPEAIDHLIARRASGVQNAIFERAEQAEEAFFWASAEWRADLRKHQRAWLDRLAELGGGAGFSQAMQTRLISASCSVIYQREPEPEQLRTWARIANFAIYHIQFLQRPQVGEAERLTDREHECMYRAAILGERPSAIARQLGIKVNTVRRLRQNARERLDAQSLEHLVWRMLESGQLFRRRPKNKPRPQ